MAMRPDSAVHRKDTLRDFTADPRLLLLAAMAVVVGTTGAGSAWLLLRLIALFTNLAYFQRLSITPVNFADLRLPLWTIAIPVIGSLIVGMIARFGSEKIRGHGIPEAIEAILIGQSRIEAKVAVLKPLSSAIAIGTGGPFGAEGPIIMTGGALGSLFAQFFHLSSAERKTLLVAGAAAGMTAVFGTPLAAVLLAVELLLFEWKPRSFIPVAVAAVVATVWRPWLIGVGPLFAYPTVPMIPWWGLGLCALVGIIAGLQSALMTICLYGVEDLKIETVDIPTIAEDEVLVRVKVALTCGTDLKVWKRGYHARMIQPPALFGHELAGVIEETGSRVNGGFRSGGVPQ